MDFDQLHRRHGLILGAAVLFLIGAAPVAVHAQMDDSATAPAFTDEISEPAIPDWSRVDESPPDSSGQVLELPQVIDPDETAADETPGASAALSMDPSAADADAAMPSGDDGENPSDYANRPAAREFAQLPSATALYPAVGGWRFNPIPPTSAFIVRPGGLSPIPATSPMLTTPRGSGPVFGGWWHRVR